MLALPSNAVEPGRLIATQSSVVVPAALRYLNA